MDLERLVRPVVESSGLEFVEAGVHRENGRLVLRVTVDRPGGVDLDAIAQASGRISRRLDLEGFEPGGGRYELEVSSPGVERPLREPRDFASRVGERVKVRTDEPVEGSRTLAGTIVAADEHEVRIATETGVRAIGYERICAARTVFEWGPAAGPVGNRTNGAKHAKGGRR